MLDCKKRITNCIQLSIYEIDSHHSRRTGQNLVNVNKLCSTGHCPSIKNHSQFIACT